MFAKLTEAVRFLTILPLPLTQIHTAENNIGKSSACFPLVGLMQGFLLILVYALFVRIFPNDIVAALLVSALLLSNGGFIWTGFQILLMPWHHGKAKKK